MPFADQQRRRDGAEWSRPIQVAREDVYQPFTPELQLGLEDIEGSDCDEVLVQRLPGGTRKEKTAPQDSRQDQPRDHACGDEPSAWAPHPSAWGTLFQDQRLRKFVGRGEALRGIGSERPLQRILYPSRHCRITASKGGRPGDEPLGDEGLWRHSGEGWLAGETLVQHATERVEITPSVDLPLAGCLLRAHVHRSAQRKTGSGQPLTSCRAHRLGYPEVCQDRFASFQQDVLGLDIAMDDTELVGTGECSEYVAGDAEHVLQREPLLALQPLPQRLTLDIGHGVPQTPGGFAGVEEREDVWVTELCGESDLE